MRIDYGQGEKEAIIGIHTMMIYEQEFRSDIVQDIFGRQVLREEKDGDDVVFAVDYRNVQWTAALKVLWAALKTADDSVPSFSEWSNGLGPVNLDEIVSAIVPEVRRQFFRPRAVEPE